MVEKLNDEQILVVVPRHHNGESINSLARELDIDGKTLSKHFSRLGVKILQTPTIRKTEVELFVWSTTSQRDQETIRQYQNGRGALLISRSLGISKKTVYRILCDNKVNSRKVYVCKHIKKIERMYKDGSSCNKIAKAFNMTGGAVEYQLRKRGIKLRSPSESLRIIPIELRKKVIDWYVSEDHSSYDITNRLKEQFGCEVHPNCIQLFINRAGVMRSGDALRAHIARKQKNKNHKTKIEKTVERLLNEMDLDYNWQPSLEKWTFDFGVGQYLIEVQGDYWHSRYKEIIGIHYHNVGNVMRKKPLLLHNMALK